MFIYTITLYLWLLLDCVIRFCFDFFGHSGEESTTLPSTAVHGVPMAGLVEIFLYKIQKKRTIIYENKYNQCVCRLQLIFYRHRKEGGGLAPHPPFLTKLDIITITLILSFAFSINKEGKEL